MNQAFSTRKKGPRVFAVLVAGAMLCVMGMWGGNVPGVRNQIQANVAIQTSPQSLESIEPRVAASAPRITITGDAGWGFCPWVNGSGTDIDPYVIHDLTINGGGSGTCISIANTNKFFRIENCTVTNTGSGFYDAGIRVSSAANGILRNNTCTQNRRSGICLNATANNTLDRNTCMANYYGIYLISGNNTVISGNNCTGNSLGMWLSNSNNNTLSGNNCTGAYSIYTYGMFLSNSNNNTLSGNNCTGTYYGMYLSNSNNNTLSGNNCTGSYLNIYLYSSSNNNMLDGNNCTGGIYGIYIDSASNNTLLGNTCKGNAQWGILLYSAWNTTISGNIMTQCGIYLDGLVNSTVSTVIDTTNTVNGNPVRFLTNSHDWTVPADTGEVILANCTGMTVNKLLNPGVIIALIQSSNNNITENNCTGNNYGIYLSSSNNNTLSGNNCTGNNYGIYLSSSNNNTLEENTCTGNSGGISLYSSNNNSLTGNNCTGSNYGIYLSSSENNTLSGNNCTGGTYGIYILYASYNTLGGNNCTGGTSGINLYYANNNMLDKNNCTGGTHGIYLYSADQNTLSENNCTGGTHGIYLYSADQNTLSENNCTGGTHGIYLYSADQNTLSGNNCTGGVYGIYLYFADSNTLSGNNCTGGVYGIYLYYADSNTLSGNHCTGGTYGIYLCYADSNTLSGNNCTGGSFGIYLDSADYNTLSGSNCTGGDFGIFLYLSNCNTLSGNHCTGGVYGIYLYNAYSNTLSGNSAQNYKVRPFGEEYCNGNSLRNNWFWVIPTASFSISAPIWAGTGINFTDTTTGDAPCTYQWNFGDGTENSTQANSTHTFWWPGNYTVTLTVTDFDGDVSVYQAVIAVEPNWYVLAVSITACVSFAGIAMVYRKWGPVIAQKVGQYKRRIAQNVGQFNGRIVHKYQQIKDTLHKQGELTRQFWEEEQKREIERERRRRVAQQQMAEERTRELEAARQRMEEARKREADIARQRREAEARRIQDAKAQVERVVLELAPLFSKLQVGEIAEKCGITDEGLIINVVKAMIARKQINATYFQSTRSVAFQQQVAEKSLTPAIPEQEEKHAEVRRQYEYVGGKVRLKVKVVNIGKAGLLRVTCMLNIPDSFRLLRVEPADYSADGAAVKLQDLLPKEEKTVAFVLEPMICGKEQFSGTVSGVDAMGDPFAASIAPLEVEVHCPLFASPEEANLPLLKRMVQDLPVRGERVFYLPETLAPAAAFELAKAVISERDVRLVGSVGAEDRQEGDTFDESAWFYGLTKVGKKRYVLSAAVSEKDRTIKLATACDDEAGCTGFLAEAGAAVRRELVRRGAVESENLVVELVCEKCGATLPSAPTVDHDVRCPECQWSWRVSDFFR